MVMAKIFIRYRREDTEYPALLIYQKLVDHFGKESVVFDVDTMPLGTDFRKYPNNQVSECDILLAVIGDQSEARFDGKLVLRTNTKLPSEQVALKYKQLWQVDHSIAFALYSTIATHKHMQRCIIHI
jgi:hypothetical protein